MKCSLIITTFNWPEALSLVLGTAISQSTPPDEIIVADDGSAKETRISVKDVQKKTAMKKETKPKVKNHYPYYSFMAGR